MAIAIPYAIAVQRRVKVWKSEPAIDCLFVGIEERTYIYAKSVRTIKKVAEAESEWAI
jgi:hypothetical protein